LVTPPDESTITLSSSSKLFISVTSVYSRVCVTRKIKICHSKTKGPERAVETPERQGTKCVLSDSGRAGKGTRVQLWISYMHIVLRCALVIRAVCCLKGGEAPCNTPKAKSRNEPALDDEWSPDPRNCLRKTKRRS
jgi:hypothetical protein